MFGASERRRWETQVLSVWVPAGNRRMSGRIWIVEAPCRWLALCVWTDPYPFPPRPGAPCVCAPLL
jgi:hypothetical protein